MSVRDRLDEIQARADKATDGPWDGDYGHFGTGIVAGRVRTGPNVIGSMWRPSDGTFTAHARADVPTLVAALRAVQDGLGPHYDSQVRRNAKFGRIGSDCVCEGCNTYRAVENALKEN